MNKNIPVACRANSFNGTTENIWLAVVTSLIASGAYAGKDALVEADRLCLRIANRKWAGPLTGKYFSANALSEEEDSIAAALTKYDALMAMQDKEWQQQYEAREAAAKQQAEALAAKEAELARSLKVLDAQAD
jgi:hypothetical protein